VVNALRQAGQPGGEGALDYALRTMHEITQNPSARGLLETDDVDNIIYADIGNRDGNYDAALMAMEAFVRGDTRSDSPQEFEKVADNIGNTVAYALRVAGSDPSDGALDYALRTMHEVTQNPSARGLLETMDIDNIIFHDLNNGDNDLSAAQMALDAFVSGNTRSDRPSDFETVANNIVEHVADAGNQPHVQDFAQQVDFYLSNYTDTSSLV
ncbi:MAG: hypothetical protein AB8B83_01410, partial [Bdellovibrionales bacterium]